MAHDLIKARLSTMKHKELLSLAKSLNISVPQNNSKEVVRSLILTEEPAKIARILHIDANRTAISANQNAKNRSRRKLDIFLNVILTLIGAAVGLVAGYYFWKNPGPPAPPAVYLLQDDLIKNMGILKKKIEQIDLKYQETVESEMRSITPYKGLGQTMAENVPRFHLRWFDSLTLSEAPGKEPYSTYATIYKQLEDLERVESGTWQGFDLVEAMGVRPSMPMKILPVGRIPFYGKAFQRLLKMEASAFDRSRNDLKRIGLMEIPDLKTNLYFRRQPQGDLELQERDFLPSEVHVRPQ